MEQKSFFNLIKLALGIIISVAVLIIFLKDPLQKFELITFDYRIKSLPQDNTHPDIVLIEMAEDSVNAIGRWPWPREWHATLLKALSENGAKAVIFDILFSEEGSSLGDTSFEGVMEKTKNAYLPFVFEFRSDEKTVRNIIFPIDRFSAWTKGQGHINVFPDIDGTLRRTPLIIEYKDGKYPHMAFQIACDYLGLPKKDVISKIPVDDKNRMIIKWAGKWQDTFKHYSYIDVITSYKKTLDGKKPKINLEEFRGKICLVGLTAAGLHDVRPTPLEPAYPALGVNANIINNILKEDFIKESSKHLNAAIILILGILISLAISHLRPLRGAVVAFLILSVYIFASLALFKFLNLWINVTYPVLLILVSYSTITLYSQISMAIERSHLFTLATRDGITGLYVPRHFNLLMDAEMAITEEHEWRRKLSLIMGDIDFFKKVNDTYGHQGGNVVLKDIARIIKSNLRELDLPCRYGGEEFALMLPGATLEEAMVVAERIRKGVEDHHFKYRDKILRVTISFGVAILKDEKGREELIKKADDALYKAKRTGRNRVCIAEGSS